MGTLTNVVNRLLAPTRYRLVSQRTLTYAGDNMMLFDKNADFILEPRFAAAQARALKAEPNRDTTWRMAICCWVADHVVRLPGDFVECGVAYGATSVAVCEFIDLNSTGKAFWLFDTYSGIPIDQASKPSHVPGIERSNRQNYRESFDEVVATFRPFPKATPVRGKVPDTLSSVPIEQVCYLSIDMNIVYPEIEALKFFWPKMAKGGAIIFDDYGFVGHEEQKIAADRFAEEHDASIWALPTGQGLLFKP